MTEEQLKILALRAKLAGKPVGCLFCSQFLPDSGQVPWCRTHRKVPDWGSRGLPGCDQIQVGVWPNDGDRQLLDMRGRYGDLMTDLTD